MEGRGITRKGNWKERKKKEWIGVERNKEEVNGRERIKSKGMGGIVH